MEKESNRIWTLYNICTDENLFSPSNPYYGFLARGYARIAGEIIEEFRQWQKNVEKKINQKETQEDIYLFLER